MPGFWDTWSQFFPPKPPFTEKNVGDLKDKVYVVTGSNTGLGKELAKILYSRNARVYIAARSKSKADAAIEDIISTFPTSTGQLFFLELDLADLSTIKASAEAFLKKEQKLHVLFNNAAAFCPPQGSKSAQGHELQLGVNCLGHFLFTKLLTPTLIETAKAEAKGSVRVVWVSSYGAENGSVDPHGVDVGNLDYHDEKPPMTKYAISKAGNYYQSTEFARRHKADGVVSVALNPGNLSSDLYRNEGFLFRLFIGWFILHPPIFGAYTQLFSGLSPAITMDDTGKWIVPWGRFMDLRADLIAGSKSREEGGSGVAKEFWEWNEDQVKSFN